MILQMTKLRLIGPRSELRAALCALQDVGTVHLVAPACPDQAQRHAVAPLDRRRRRNLVRALADVEVALAELAHFGAAVPAVEPGALEREGRVARLAARVRRRVESMRAREQALLDERDALRRYAPLFDDFEAALTDEARRRFSAYLLLLRGATAATLRAFRDGLDRDLDGEYELIARELSSGETALLLLVPAVHVEDVDRWLSAANVETAPVPPAFGQLEMADALPRMRPRLEEVGRELDGLRREARAIAGEHGRELARARGAFHDELIELDAETLAVETPRAFVLEGWLPAAELGHLRARLRERFGDRIAVHEVSRDEWVGDEAPVVLANPTLFEPFERLTALLPLPRYGSVDPTPFVAVFFPMFFGIVVGDIGYGVAIAALALLLRLRSRPGGLGRDVARIAGAVAVFTVIFGALYGELFGDLGRRWLGMEALWFDREEAVLPFLALAIALGAVHLLLGLVVGAASSRRSKPRKALGRGITVAMLLLIAVALGAVFDLLPGAFFTPAIIALLVAFPLLVVAEGFTAPLELLSVVGHVLSYARVMALGTASVMLAVVANRMVGAIGSVAVGVLFALLFHLVNFAIALFSPTIHIMRLHYVEFFGTFYSPGGARYQPLAHWSAHPVTSS